MYQTSRDFSHLTGSGSGSLLGAFQTAQKWQFSGGSTLVDGVFAAGNMAFLAVFPLQTMQTSNQSTSQTRDSIAMDLTVSKEIIPLSRGLSLKSGDMQRLSLRELSLPYPRVLSNRSRCNRLTRRA